MPQLGGGDVGAGAQPPFPNLPLRLDAMMMMMMDGGRAAAMGPPGPPLVPSRIAGCPGLGRDGSLGVSLSPSCHRCERGGDGGPLQPSPLGAGGSADSLPSTPSIKSHGKVLRHPQRAGCSCRASAAPGRGRKGVPPLLLHPSQMLVPSLLWSPGPPGPCPLHPTPPMATLDTALTAGDGWGRAGAAGARDACGEVTDAGMGGCGWEGGKQRGCSGVHPPPPTPL